MKRLLALLALLLVVPAAHADNVIYQFTCGTSAASVFSTASLQMFDANGNLKPAYGTDRKSFTIANQNTVDVFFCDAASNTNAATACNNCTTSNGLRLQQNMAFTDTFGHGNECCITPSTTTTVGIVIR